MKELDDDHKDSETSDELKEDYEVEDEAEDEMGNELEKDITDEIEEDKSDEDSKQEHQPIRKLEDMQQQDSQVGMYFLTPLNVRNGRSCKKSRDRNT